MLSMLAVARISCSSPVAARPCPPKRKRVQAQCPPVHLALAAASGFDSIPMFLPALAFSGQKGTIRICAALDLHGLTACFACLCVYASCVIRDTSVRTSYPSPSATREWKPLLAYGTWNAFSCSLVCPHASPNGAMLLLIFSFPPSVADVKILATRQHLWL
jgi:hypothetical protein